MFVEVAVKVLLDEAEALVTSVALTSATVKPVHVRDF